MRSVPQNERERGKGGKQKGEHSLREVPEEKGFLLREGLKREKKK